MEGFKTSFLNQELLPLVIEPEDPTIPSSLFLSLLQRNLPEIKEKLLKYGGVLFRNFPIDDVDDFATTIDHLQCGERLDYLGGDSPRDKVKRKVYTSTEAPPSIKIPLHNEMSFVRDYPTHIFFYCAIPPSEGGETIIADAREIYLGVDPEVRKRFNAKQLKYVTRYYSRSLLLDLINKLHRGHKTWMEAFETESKEIVEETCKKKDYLFKWYKNDWLEINQIRPATLVHPLTRETVWFNQAHLYDFNPKLIGMLNYLGVQIVYSRKNTKSHDIYYADSSPIPREDLYHVMDVLDQKTVHFPWRKNDLLMLDNVLAMHGRAPFKGKRRILTALTRES